MLLETAATSAPVPVLRCNHLRWAEQRMEVSSPCVPQLHRQTPNSLCPQLASTTKPKCFTNSVFFSLLPIIFDTPLSYLWFGFDIFSVQTGRLEAGWRESSSQALSWGVFSIQGSKLCAEHEGAQNFLSFSPVYNKQLYWAKAQYITSRLQQSLEQC